MDLVAGLHWLRENLSAFGGDPQRITLMGHDTGAALVNIISVSPVAKGKCILKIVQMNLFIYFVSVIKFNVYNYFFIYYKKYCTGWHIKSAINYGTNSIIFQLI